MKKFFTFSNSVIFSLIILNLGAFIAPLLLSVGLEGPAKLLYFIYSFFCHQIDWRSLHVHDHQYAWCARDTAIWGAILLTFLAMKKYKFKGLKWYYIIPFSIPIALDGGLQLVAVTLGYGGAEPFYIATNLTRTITGSLWGIGLGMVMGPFIFSLDEEFIDILDKKSKTTFAKIELFGSIFMLNRFQIIVVLFSIMMAIYLVQVQVWALTSSEVKPTNFLDSEVKLPEDKADWMIRRGHAVCPVNLSPIAADDSSDSSDSLREDNKGTRGLKEMLALDCFF